MPYLCLVISGFAAWMRVKEVPHWASCVSAVMTFFVAVEAFKVFVVTYAHNLVFSGAVLTVVIRRVSFTTDKKLN